MKNKRIIMSFLLILLIATSVSAISAADPTNDQNLITSDNDGMIIDEINKDANDKSLSNGELNINNNWIVKPSSNESTDAAAIQKCIDNSASSGDTIKLTNYNYTLEKGVSLNKNLKIEGGSIYNKNNLSELFTIVPKSEGGPSSITITGTTFYVNGNENIVLAKGENISSKEIIDVASINITNCKIIPIYQDIDSDISGTNLVNLQSDRTLGLSTGNISITKNLLNGAKAFKNNDFIANDTLFVHAQNVILNTSIEVKNISVYTYDKNIDEPNYLEVKLVDEKGNPIANQTIYIAVAAEKEEIITDENGIAKYLIKLSKSDSAYISYLGEDGKYNGVDMIITNIEVTKKTPSITAKTYTYNVNAKSKKISITVKDNNNKLVINKAVKITVNGKTYNAKTNETGVATITAAISKKGTYTYTAKVTGNSVYKEVRKKGKLVINGLSSALTLKKYTFKRYANKKIAVTLKSGKSVLKKKTITLKINGKTYTVKTNSKGVATVNIILTKKGTYKYTVKFAGDNTYKATSKSAKAVIK